MYFAYNQQMKYTLNQNNTEIYSKKNKIKNFTEIVTKQKRFQNY